MAKAKTKKKAKAKAARPAEKRLHDEKWIARHIEAFARDIAASAVLNHVLIVGIQRRGAELARRVRERVHQLAGEKVPYGALDITLYRDDIALRGPKLRTQKEGTKLEGCLDNRVVFLIDDVLCTGRTIRAAMDQIMDFGRPGAVRLYSLIDRGGRELPIQPDRVGERMTVPLADRVDVRLTEVDGEEGVVITRGGMR